MHESVQKFASWWLHKCQSCWCHKATVCICLIAKLFTEWRVQMCAPNMIVIWASFREELHTCIKAFVPLLACVWNGFIVQIYITASVPSTLSKVLESLYFLLLFEVHPPVCFNAGPGVDSKLFVMSLILPVCPPLTSYFFNNLTGSDSTVKIFENCRVESHFQIIRFWELVFKISHDGGRPQVCVINDLGVKQNCSLYNEAKSAKLHSFQHFFLNTVEWIPLTTANTESVFQFMMHPQYELTKESNLNRSSWSILMNMLISFLLDEMFPNLCAKSCKLSSR